MNPSNPTKYVEDVEAEFDDRFGRGGPEENSDSLGRGAGCDDCVVNIRLRDEHRDFLTAAIEAALKEGAASEKAAWKELMGHLYFVEGLEELRHMSGMKPEYLDEWSKTVGEKYCQIFFALTNGATPEEMMTELLTSRSKV